MALHKRKLIYRFCPEKRPWDVSPRPLPPSSRNVKFQNNPLIVVSIALSRANGPGQNMLQESFSRATIKDEHNQYLFGYYTFFGCNYDIFSQFCFLARKKIYNFHLNRNVKQQNPYPLNVPGTFLRTKMSLP